MPPVAAAPPVIGTLGRRRRPVRSIRFARNAPRAPPQSPGEGRLPPVRVRLRSSGRARWWHASRRRARRSRVVSALQMTYPGDQRRTAARSLRRMPKLPAQLGFLRTKIDLDASGTFGRLLRNVIYRGAGVEPSQRIERLCLTSSFTASKTRPPQPLPAKRSLQRLSLH